MLQIRLSLPSFGSGVAFSDPIIMDGVDNITLIKTVSSSDESIAFEVPLTDDKLEYVNYLRWWECWDTTTNTRLNYGPIETISRGSGDSKRVTGPGRSALLADFYKSIQTFYYPIDIFFDDLRYENMAGEPRAKAVIGKGINSKYYGLSDRTKDRAIDEQTGYIAIGRDSPVRGIRKTDSYWSGVGKSDFIIVDLGIVTQISKLRLLLPWWGGATINNERTYDYRVRYSTGSNYRNPDINPYTTIWASDIPNHAGTSPEEGGRVFYFGEEGFEIDQISVTDSNIPARYWLIDILDTHAFYGSAFQGSSSFSDEWNWECGGSNVFKGVSKPSPSVANGTLIGETEQTPSNDCFASVVELAIMRKIIGKDTITKLAYHQIDGLNRQITYFHQPAASEMLAGGTKFEPGNFFRKLTFIGDSAEVKDDYNVPIFSGASGSQIQTPAYAKFVTFSNPVQVSEVDTWPGFIDAFSYAGSYSFSEVAGDTATLHFRGVSWKWFASIPSDKTPGTVSIEWRVKDTDGRSTNIRGGVPVEVFGGRTIGLSSWSNWHILESSFTLPEDVSGEKVYEVTYESGLFEPDKTYEIKITNLDGNFVSIDSFAGYWEATMETLNEDDPRVAVRLPNEELQIYDQRFTGGSIYEYKPGTGSFTKQGLKFEGDRVIVYSRKGPDYGTIKIGLFNGRPNQGESGVPDYRVYIPGGEADGSLEVDLNYPYDIAQAVVFDSADYFTDPPLEWNSYMLGIYRPNADDILWVDGFEAHQASGLSVKFLNTNHLDILKSTTEATQMEWDITEMGIKVVPRVGTDTDIIFAEGRGTTIKIEDVQDVGQVATMLVGSGADIDGLPLTTVVEDRKTRKVIGRTIQRLYDARNIGDYFTLIGASRAELLRRREPQKRVTVQTRDIRGLQHGDSFIVKHPDLEARIRANTITRTQSSSGGSNYQIEGTIWPPTI